MAYTLITGATSGIGECMAYALASEARNLILVGRNEDKLKYLQKDIKKTYNVKVQTYKVDMQNQEELEALVAYVRGLEEKIELFVNNAGVGHYGLFEKGNAVQHQETIDVNISAFTYLTRGLFPCIASGSQVLQVASTASFAPGPYMAVYYASKAYVLSLSLALRNEWRQHGIGVSVLCPGPTKTSFQSKAHMEKSDLAKRLAMTPEAVVASALKGLKKNKALIIPGMTNKIAARMMEVLPNTWGAHLVSGTQQKERGGA
ncbi:MAG: SDR family NAD(P)-dependent oxidoreductase [Cellulosilyticaceae bacterium]